MAVKQRTPRTGRSMPRDVADKYLQAMEDLRVAQDNHRTQTVNMLQWVIKENRLDLVSLKLAKIRREAWDNQSTQGEF